MRRADLLKIVELTPVRFHTLTHRGGLPFKESARTGWAEYSAANALQLELSLALASRGPGQQGAAILVRVGFADLIDVARAGDDADDLACGFFQVESFSYAADERGRGIVPSALTHFVAGRVTTIANVAAETASKLKGTLSTLVVINVSQRLRTLRARAELSPRRDQLLAEFDAVWGEPPKKRGRPSALQARPPKPPQAPP